MHSGLPHDQCDQCEHEKWMDALGFNSTDVGWRPDILWHKGSDPLPDISKMVDTFTPLWKDKVSIDSEGDDA